MLAFAWPDIWRLVGPGSWRLLGPGSRFLLGSGSLRLLGPGIRYLLGTGAPPLGGSVNFMRAVCAKFGLAGLLFFGLSRLHLVGPGDFLQVRRSNFI